MACFVYQAIRKALLGSCSSCPQSTAFEHAQSLPDNATNPGVRKWRKASLSSGTFLCFPFETMNHSAQSPAELAFALGRGSCNCQGLSSRGCSLTGYVLRITKLACNCASWTSQPLPNTHNLFCIFIFNSICKCNGLEQPSSASVWDLAAEVPRQHCWLHSHTTLCP